MVVVIMGVSGSGKTTVGELLAEKLGYPYYDGDDFHPQANVAKMRQGIPLEDEDRWPWLQRLAAEIGLWLEGGGAVLGCSALKETYRRVLLDSREGVHLVHLVGTKELIQARLAQRQHKYMPASLLDSQFATLEPPANALCVDIDAEPDRIVQRIRRGLGI